MMPQLIICGVEHSGTTLLSDVFRQVPRFNSGFEVGVLLSQNPKEFRTLEPFVSNMKSGWELTDEQLDDICNCGNFTEFYKKLQEKSSILSDNDIIFDKTPRYFADLSNCLDKVDCNFIATYKDPRSIVYSDYKRAGKIEFNQWFEDYYPKKLGYLKTVYSQYQASKKHQGERVIMLSLEDVALDTRHTFEKIFSVVDIDFRIEYLMLKNLKYQHTRAAYVSSKIPFEYMDGLDDEQEKMIIDKFSDLDEWFYQ